jgi:hypothetical protein
VAEEELEQHERPSIRIPMDMGKLLPYILLAASWVIAYVRSNDSAEYVKMQVQAEQADIKKINEQLFTIAGQLAQIQPMADRLSKLENKVDNYIEEQAESGRRRR